MAELETIDYGSYIPDVGGQDDSLLSPPENTVHLESQGLGEDAGIEDEVGLNCTSVYNVLIDSKHKAKPCHLYSGIEN